jgi:hypothetical protein
MLSAQNGRGRDEAIVFDRAKPNMAASQLLELKTMRLAVAAIILHTSREGR